MVNHHLEEMISSIYLSATETQDCVTRTIEEVIVDNKNVISIENITTFNYVSTTNMIQDKGGISDDVSLPTSKTVKSFQPKDILISNIRPYFKKIWYADRTGGYSSDILNFRANTDVISPEILWAYLYQDDFFEAVVKSSKGTKMPRGDKNAIKKMLIKIPRDYQPLTDIIQNYLELIIQNNKQNKILIDLKNILLPKLLSGEISITD